jgi:hypothetical protein
MEQIFDTADSMGISYGELLEMLYIKAPSNSIGYLDNDEIIELLREVLEECDNIDYLNPNNLW